MSTAASPEPCIRCERKGFKCRPGSVPGSKDCKACTTAGAKCFRPDPLDRKMLALVDANTPKSYKALSKLQLALFKVVKYNKALREDARDANSLVGDVTTASKPRETIKYVVDISWSYDLFVMTNHFGTAIEAFLKSSAEAKVGFIAEHTPKQPTIAERIKQLRFTFSEDDEGDYDAHWPAPPAPAAPALTEEQLAEFKIDSDTTELLMEAYNSFLKLFNLAVDPLERAVNKCGITAPIRFRGDEHVDIDDDTDDDSDEEETPEPVVEPVVYKNAKARRKAEKKVEKKAALEAAVKEAMKKQKEMAKRVQVMPVGTFAETLYEQKAHTREAFENALKECVKVPGGVEAARKTDDNAQNRYRHLLNKMEKSG